MSFFEFPNLQKACNYLAVKASLLTLPRPLEVDKQISIVLIC